MAIITLALISASLALWLSVWLSRPRLPSPFNETAWLVYARMLSNRDGIQLMAVIASYATFFAGIITLISNA